MKIIITESQNERLLENFSPIEYLRYLLNKKEVGADTFTRYKWIQAFQKFVDLIYKYTIKTTKFDGVKGIKVATVWRDNWGETFSRPDLPPSRLDYTIRVYPIVDENNPPSSQEKFNEDYENFQKEFENISDAMGLEIIQPVEDEKTKNIRIRFNFMDLDIRK